MRGVGYSEWSDEGKDKAACDRRIPLCNAPAMLEASLELRNSPLLPYAIGR